MSDDLEFIVIDDIPEYIFCIGDDEENEQVIALSGKDGAFKYEKVDELPTAGEDGVLYLVPKSHTTQTASGNPINVNITDNAGKIESLKLDGDTFQQSYTGKNLFDGVATKQLILSDGTITDNNSWNLGGYIKVNPNTTYTVSFNLGSGGSHSVLVSEFDSSKDFIVRGGSQSTTPYTFTTSSTTEYIRLNYNNTNNDTNFQVELGSTATSYEPYVGGPSPNPSYPQQIQTVTGTQTISINGTDYPISLSTTRELDMSQATRLDAYINGSGVIVSSGGDALFSIQVEPNATYTLTKTVSSRFRYACTSTTPTIGANVGTTTNADSATSATITTGVSDTYLVCVYWSSNSTQTKDAIFNSVEITERKSIELCKLGTYQDYIYKDGDSWKVHKATATITLTGASSENWYIDQYAYMLNNVISAKAFSDIANMEAYCRSFSKSATGQTSSYAVSFWYNTTGTGVRFIKDQTPDLSSFRNWLASNNQTVYYPLATSTDTTITDTTFISHLEAIRTAALESGSNTISNTATGTNLAGDLEIGYYGYDPLNKYDKYFWLAVDGAYESL